MKKAILSAVLLLLTISLATAQPKHRGPKKMDFTPEQKATLAVKKMALILDLSTSQQKKLKPLIIEGINKKEAAMAAHRANKGEKKKLSSEEAYIRMNGMLDAKMEAQNKIKSILNKDQFQKWQKMRAHRGAKKGSRKGHQQKANKRKGPHGSKDKITRRSKEKA
ncbi:hypothetical protein ACFLRU_02370 [Bacteroidota bacterium]